MSFVSFVELFIRREKKKDYCHLINHLFMNQMQNKKRATSNLLYITWKTELENMWNKDRLQMPGGTVEHKIISLYSPPQSSWNKKYKDLSSKTQDRQKTKKVKKDTENIWERKHPLHLLPRHVPRALRFGFSFIFKVYKEALSVSAMSWTPQFTCGVTLYTWLISGLSIRILPVASPGYKRLWIANSCSLFTWISSPTL